MLRSPAALQPLMTLPDGAAPQTLLVWRDRLLLREHDLGLPDQALPRGLGRPPAAVLALGLWRSQPWELHMHDAEMPAPAGHAWFGLRALFGVWDEEMLGLAGRALQLAEWARSHRYCGVCATAMERMAGERAARCPSCGFTAYPRISPAMMVLVRKGDAVLLARHTNSPYQRFTALAGFLEAGESVEEAVHREVCEEVGLRVHNLQYFGSQSWPFPHSLMIAFTADYLDGEIRVDETEIAEARWFGPGDDFPDVPPGVSIAAALINAHRPG